MPFKMSLKFNKKRGMIVKNKIALIPVDARPVSDDLARDLGNMAGWKVMTPDKDVLGFLKEEADTNAILTWIEKIAPEVDGMVISMDMVLYGGLVPSRINTDPIQVIEDRLSRLVNLKALYPDLTLMIFSSTMRLSNSYENSEEKMYWTQYGKEIWTYSYHFHRYERMGLQEDYDEYIRVKNKIPHNILQDYLLTRDRNFQINLKLLNYVENGVLELLVYPQDDTSEFGLNIMEQEQLKDEIEERELFNEVLIYPGADEVAALLTARLIYNLENKPFPTYYPIYSGLRGALTIARFEDRIIHESVKGQIYALGSHTVESVEEADIILGVNVPGDKQGETYYPESTREVDTNNRNIGEWLSRLFYYKKKNKLLGIIDVAYANGADVTMVPQLLKRFPLKSLDGFAAWNTAGNTIGTVIAQTALVKLAEEKKLNRDKEKEKMLLIRFLDDYLYQSIVRHTVLETINYEEVPSDELLRIVKENYWDKAELFIKKNNSTIEIKDIYLPWKRTFEIGIHLK